MERFTEEQQERIIHAIQLAEARTSGEIRLTIESRCPGDPLQRATDYFHHLGMDRTALHNGVLIYLATDDHQFAIIGDRGIDEKVPVDFWKETTERMLHHFQHGDLVQGVIEGIIHAGEQLHRFFPRQDDDINELPNDIVFGDDRH